MAKLSTCPRLGDLEALAAGRQTPAVLESLVEHLEGCDQCLDKVRTLSPNDTLIVAVGQANAPILDEDEQTVAQLMDRLSKISHAGSADTSLEVFRASGAAEPEEVWNFLAPAQSPGELGRLGPYRVLRVLGRGGMGVVFQAEDPKLQRVLALKVMLPALASSPSAKKRFLREAKAAAAVKHDHIVRILEVGEDRGVPFLAMEFLDGESLDARLKRGPLSVAEILHIGRQVADGLAAAHERGLIHRDIKPGNIWLETVGSGQWAVGSEEEVAATSSLPTGHRPRPTNFRVKILDFGLARLTGENAHLTRSGAVMGTPAYMAPEQATGKPLDQRCDLFSLGCVLYRISTGEFPFKGKNSLTVLAALANVTPQPPCEVNQRIPAELSDLIVRLLSKDRDQRPANAREVVEALDACPSEEATVGPVLIGQVKETRPKRTYVLRKRRVAVAGLALLALAAVAFFLWPPNSGENKGAEIKPVLRPPKPVAPSDAKPIEGKTPDTFDPADYALALDGACFAAIPSLKLNRSAPLTLEAFVIVRKTDERQPIHLAGVPQQFSLFTGQTKVTDGEHFSLGVQYVASFHHLFDPAPIPIGRRVHLAGVREGRSARYYLDGKLIASREFDEPMLNDSKSTFGIGNNGVFEGAIDEVRVSMIARYDRDFTPAKRFQPDVDTLALYHMDEGEGTQVKDASGNGHHGAIHGNARWVKADGSPITP